MPAARSAERLFDDPTGPLERGHYDLALNHFAVRNHARWSPPVLDAEPGTRDAFHALFLREALPLLQQWRVNVVAYGPSLHDRDSYFLMRAFASVEERESTTVIPPGMAAVCDEFGNLLVRLSA